MKNRKKIKKIVLAVSATSGSLPLVFLPISQTNTTGSSQEIDSKYLSYSQYNKVQDDGIYTNYNTVEGMFFEGWALGQKKGPIYIGTNPNYSKNESGYDKSKYYINERNNWYRLYDYNANKEKWDRYRDNYNPAWDLLNPSLVLNESTINTRYNWQKNDNKDSSFFNGDGWDSVNDTKSFRVGFNVDKLRSDDRKFLVGLWISEDLILTGNIKAIVSTRNTNNPFQEVIANPSNVRTYNISVDEKYDVNDVKDKTNSATWYGKEEYKYRINPWISKSYDYTGVFKKGDNHSGFKFYSSNKNNEYAQFGRYYVSDENKYTTGKTWLNSMHYGSFYKSFPKEINQNITNQYGILWGGVANDYFRKRTIANMIIHDEPSLDGDWKYAPVAYGGNEYKLGLYQKQYKDSNNYIYDSLNNNAGSLLILEIKSEDKNTAGFTPSLQLEFTVKRNPNTIDNNGVRSGNNANPLSRDSSSKKTYIGFGQFKYEQSNWANRQFGSFMKMADRQAYQNIKFNTTEKLVKSEYLLDNDKLPNTTLSLIEHNNGSERLIHSVNKSKYNEVINKDKILAEYKTKNNVDSLTQYSNINNLRLKTSFVNSEDYKKWKIVSENSYSTQNPNIFSFNTTDGDGYLNFNEISYDLTDYEKLKRFANDRTKNKWLTIKQINYLLSQIEQNENFNKTTYSFNDPKWFEYFKEQISNLNNLQGQAETKRAELRNLILSTTDKTEWNSEISNRVLFAFSDPREAKSPAWNLLEREGYWNWQSSSLQRKYNIQSELNSNSEAIDRNDDSKVILQTTTEIEKFIADVNNVINKIKETGKSNLESEFINTLNNQSITNSTWSKYNYNQGTKFIINAINSIVANRNTPYDLTTFTATTNQQYKNDKTSILNKVQNLSTLYDAIQNIQTTIQNLKNDDLVYGKTPTKPVINDEWYNNFVEKLQNANNIKSDSSYAFSSQNNLDTFRTDNANKLKTNWTDKIIELNGNKNQFTTDINSFNYLDSSVKQSFIQRIPAEKNFVYSETNYQLTDNRNTINNQLTSLINEAFTQSKTKAKEKINSFAFVSQSLKTTASNNIDSAELYKNTTNNAQDNWVYFGNDQNLKTIVDELEKQNNYHKQLIDYLDSKTLNGKGNVLSQKQKEAFKNDILSKNFADQNEVNEYKKSIDNVNDATQNLKTYVTNLNTNTDKYNFASPDKKRTFDAYKAAAESLLNNKSGTIDSSKISKLQENLTNAYNALDGDIFINKVKELNYLTTNLQNLIIEQIKAVDPSQRQAIYEKAKKLNDDFGTTDLTLINTYNSAKSTPDYTDGSKVRKSAFDTALTNLNAKLNTSKNKLEQPTQIPTNYRNFIENYISQYDQLKSTIATAYSELDGNEITAEKARLNAINLTFDYPSKETVLPSEIRDSSITNNLPNDSKANVVTSNISKTDSNGTVSLNYQLVSTDPKFSYLPEDEKIKSISKSATINGFLTSSQKAFNDKKASLIEAINQAKNANKITESQKQVLIDAVNKATSLDELNKQEAKDNEIFKLTSTYEHLNPKQNQELFEKIQNATSIQDAQTIFAKQENVNLNNSMKKLKDLVSEYTSKKTNVDYTSATNQSQFDAILKSATDLISSTTNNGTSNPSLNTLIGDINQSGSLNNSFALLDGIKNKAKNDINGLSYLTETQKQQYKSEIDRISDLQASKTKQAEVDKVLTKAKLNQYNATFDYANKSKITPSEIVDNNITKTIVYNSPLGSSTITTDQIVIKEIVRNNADGTATVKYVIKDATDSSLTSEVKEATIRGFKTSDQVEKERLNAINSVTVQATPEQKQNQASKLTNPQELQWNIQSNQNAEIVDKTIVSYNDITGTLKVSYRLKSKTSTNIYSDVKYAEIDGFLTALDKAKRDAKEYINNSQTLSNDEKTKFNNLIDQQNNITDVNNKLLEAQKQELINQIDQTYTYLNPKQKENLKTLINSATSKEDAQTKFNSYSDLNNKMHQLSDLVTKYENTTSDAKYTNATESAKNNFKTAYEAAKTLLASATDDGASKLDQYIANRNTPNSLDNLYDALDGLQNNAINQINELPYLNQNEKTALINKIKQVPNNSDTKESSINAIVEQATNANKAKKSYIDTIQGLSDLSETEKTNFKNQIINNSIINNNGETTDQSDTNDSILKEAKKQNWSNQIDKLTSINSEQKQAFKDQLSTNKTDSENEKVVNDAKAYDALDKQAKDFNQTFNKDQIKYIFAQDNLKTTLNNALDSFAPLINTNATNIDLNELQTKLNNFKQAVNNLDGEQQLQDLKDKIDTFTSLSENQRQTLKNQVSQTNNLTEAKKLVSSAEGLNTKLNDLNTLITNLETDKTSNTRYLNEDSTNKVDYDRKLVNAKNQINDNFKQDFNTANIANDIANKITAIDDLSSSLNQAKDTLDGDRKEFKRNLDNFALWKDNQKDTFNQKIDQLPKDFLTLQPNKKTEIFNEIFSKMQENARDKVNNSTLSQDDKNALINRINNAQIDTNTAGKSYDWKLVEILKELDQNNQQKLEAKKQIEALTNLNKAQKDAWLTKVDAADLDDLDQVVADATALDTAMASYKTTPSNLSNIKQGVDYTESSNQNTLDNLITQRDNANNYLQGSNLSLDEVNNAITAINNAVKALDGEERVEAAKNTAKNNINNNYTSLTQNQKDLAIKKINELNSVSAIENQDKVNKNLNDAMKSLRDEIAKESTIKQSEDYIYETNNGRNGYQNALDTAKDLLTTLETSQDETTLFNKDDINTKTTNLANVTLNGAQRKADELARLTALDSQPSLKNGVNQSKTASQVLTNDIEFKTLTDANATVSNITNTNEETGAVTLNYQLRSTKENLESLTVDKSTTVNTLSEKQRLDQLIDNDQVAKNITYPNSQNVIRSEISKDNFVTQIAQDTQAKIVIDSFSNNSNNPKAVDIIYHLVSTKDGVSAISKTKTITLDSFQSDVEREQNTINAYGENDYSFTADNTKLASYFKDHANEIQISAKNATNREDETIEIKRVLAYNDVEGTLKVEFLTKSNKNGTELTSTTKVATISGYQTESQRLNNLLNTLNENNINVAKDKANTLASNAINSPDYTYNLSNSEKATLNIINTISPNNEWGKVTFDAKLVSTKTKNELVYDVENTNLPEITTPITSNSKSLEITGFRTQAEQDRLDKEAEVARLNNLAATFDYTDKATTLPSDANKKQITSNITNQNPEATVDIKDITAYDEITGAITFTYTFVSVKDGIYNSVESEAKTATLNGFKTEKMRLDELLTAHKSELEAKINNLASNLYKDNLASNVINNFVIEDKNNSLTDAIINVVLKETDDVKGQISYTYNLVSTKTLSNNQNLLTQNSETTSGILSGFKTNADVESERLNNAQSYTVDYANKATTLASSLKDDAMSNWTWNKPNDADYEFIERKVIAYDDVNGKIKVEFKLKSTKNNLGKEVISDKKVVELTGFLTEKERLDNLIKATQTSSVITNNEDALTKKPSQLTDNDFTITKPEAWNNENINISLVIENQDRDDETGTIKVSYQLSTTRTDLVSGYDNVDQSVVSDNSPKVTFNNYLTTNQEEINRLDAINPTYTNLNNQLLPSQITTNNSNSAFSINLPQDAEAQVVNLAIESQNDKDGSLTISYQLQSTKNNLNTLQSAKKTYTFNQANNNQYFTEKQRLDLLAYNPDLSAQTKATKTASEIIARDIQFANVENATVLVSDVNIASINEVTGEVQITYLATSQRSNLTDVKSSVKNATLNTLTELQRLNNLVDAREKVFNFAGDKAQNLTTVDEVSLEQLSGYLAQEIDNQKTNILSQNKAKLVIDSIESTNSETGEIVLNWHLESTKNNLNNQVVKTANKQYTLTGFQTANEREQQELNALENTDFTFTYARTKLASELKTNPSGISIQSNREDTTAESVKVIAYNDVTGELVLQYVAKSTKNGTNFTSEAKTVTLNGFKTEQQRLDQLADNLSNTSLIFNNDNSTRVNYLPSNATSTTQNNYVYANNVNDQASLNTMTFSADDETGSLTSQITLRSDKSRNDLIWAEDNLKYNNDYQYSTVTSKAKELILTGFRTQNEQNNLDQAAERSRLNDLSASFDYKDKTNVLPSDSVKNAITSQINQADSQATVKIIQINTKDEINGQITGKYVFVSAKDGIYSNLESDEKEFTITGFKTESQRLNDLLTAIEAKASIQNVNSDQYKNHLPEEVLNQLILSASNLTNAQIQIVNKNANSADAAIDYTYRLVSTRGIVNGQNLNDVASTATKNGQLPGFKSLKEAEKERLDAINVNNADDQFSHTIDYADKNSQLASSLTQATGQNWNWQVNPDSDHEFVDQQIVGYNDITGELKVSYKLQSKKSGFESVQSETKYAIISGFKTEKQRLDDLVNNNQNQPVIISQNSDTLKDGAKAKKASDLETSDFATTLTSTGENQNIKVYLELDTKNADNEHGTILVGYQLESTRNLTGENGLVSENWENKPVDKPLIKSEKSSSQEFSGYVTNDDEEANRIEKLLPLIKLDYPDKSNYLPLLNENEVLNENVQVKFKDGRNLIDEQVQLKPNSLTIVKRDDEQGLIQVQYTLVSTTRNNIERVVNATAQEDAKQLTGFKTELQRLQALNYDWQNQITNKNSVSPSDLDQANINAIDNELDQVTNIQITSRNDKTGVISGTYSIYSKRPNLNTIHIDNLTFTINGLQTEDQRLDRVIADQNIAKSITYNKNDQNTTKASALVANKSEVIKNLNNSYFVTSVANNEVNKAQIVIDDINENDETGTLTVTYHLTSLKEGLTDQRSSATQALEIGGFLTNLQDAKNKAKNYIDQLVAKNKLTADQADEFKQEIDQATNNAEITKVKTKADKQVIINDALNNFTNLNQSQKDKLIEDITNSSDINEAQKIKEKYSDLNDKMGDLANLVAEYKKKTAEDKYTKANENAKDAFDDVIAKAEELLDKNNSTDLGTNIDEFLGTKEDHSDGSIVQKYEALDGEIQKVIKQVEASELLSDDQKTSFKEELDKVSPKDLSYTENNQTKTLDDIKADILEKEQEKQRYINAINTFENLNQQQKDDYINQIKAANSSELETINEEARLLDNEMAKLKEAAKDQEAIQADSKYLEADEAVKNAYETAIIEADKVINGRPTDATENDDFNYNVNKEQVTKLIEKLNLAKLNIEKDASKKAIDNLPNLNQNEKNNAKDLIDQATSKTQVETIQAIEKIRNDKKQPYIDQIQSISNLTDAEKTNYINEIKNTNLNLSPDNVVENVADFEAIILKAQKESLIKELEKSVNNYETTRILNAKQLEYFKNEINNATNSKQAQSAFASAIEVADKMANLKEKVAKYTELINDLNNTKYQNADNQGLIQNKLKVANELLNSTTENGLDRDNDNLDNLVANNENNQSLDYAYDILNGKENVLKEKVNNSDLLSEEEKTSLNEQIDNIDKLNNEDEQITEIAKTIANKEEAKQDAIDQINNLEHLNQSQKDSLINEIKSSNAQEKDNIVNKAQELDKAMGELQNEVQNSDEIHQSTAYQNATDEEKNNYDNALENAKQVLNNQKPNDYASSNLEQNEVVELINKLREIAKTIANKEGAKQDAIDQINNLEHLNQSQKDSLINEIKSSNAQEKDNIVNKAKELDKAMDELQKEVQNSDEIHQSTAYQNATDEEKNNYDNALENAKQVLNNQKPNDYASSNLNQNEVAELINKLREIKNKQNKNITEVLDTKELIASLNDLVNLTKTDKWNKFTKEQKDAINNAIINSNNILDNLDKYTNDDLKEQTEINRLLLNTKVNSKIWWLLILTAGTIATMGFIFIILALKRRKVEDED